MAEMIFHMANYSDETRYWKCVWAKWRVTENMASKQPKTTTNKTPFHRTTNARSRILIKREHIFGCLRTWCKHGTHRMDASNRRTIQYSLLIHYKMVKQVESCQFFSSLLSLSTFRLGRSFRFSLWRLYRQPTDFHLSPSSEQRLV